MAEISTLPPILGTTIKIAVFAELGNDIHMSDVNFSCVVFNKNAGANRKYLELSKQDMIYVDDDQYIAVVDTTKVGCGEYFLVFSADVPDENCEDGIRKEIVEISTGIKVNYR